MISIKIERHDQDFEKLPNTAREHLIAACQYASELRELVDTEDDFLNGAVVRIAERGCDCV